MKPDRNFIAGVSLKGTVGYQFPLLLSNGKGWEQVSLLQNPCHNMLPSNNSKSYGVQWLWTDTFETVSQKQPFPLSIWLPQVFCYSNEYLTKSGEAKMAKLCISWWQHLMDPSIICVFLIVRSVYCWVCAIRYEDTGLAKNSAGLDVKQAEL